MKTEITFDNWWVNYGSYKLQCTQSDARIAWEAGIFEGWSRYKDEQKPLTDYLEQNFYVEQRKVMDIYLDHLWRVKINQVEHISGLEEKLRDMASTYVHGANLTAVISSNRQLRAAIQAVLNHRHEDKDGNFVVWIGEGTFLQCEEALNQTTESEK